MSDNRADIEKFKRAIEQLDHNIHTVRSWYHLYQPVDIIGFEVGNLAKCQIECSLAGITARELAETLILLLSERRRQALAWKSALERTGEQPL